MSGPCDSSFVPGVCEIETWSAHAANVSAPDLLLEIPHGATQAGHYHAVRRQLSGELPVDLEQFYFVNTDAGAPECARETARLVAQSASPEPVRKVMVVRSLIPRTFIDCNRILGAPEDHGNDRITAAIPDYIVSEADRETVTALYRAYVEVAERAYGTVCGRGGIAIILHTYAPRSIELDRIDANIVAALREAYSPERYGGWKVRPDVDFITETSDGVNRAPRQLLARIRAHYERIGIEPTENASYRLHASTLGYRFSMRFPGQVLCIEISRALLADPFTPFEEMKIHPHKAARIAGPIAAGYMDATAASS